MRPARRIKQAEGIARELHKLLSSSPLFQLLQRTPPAALTAQLDVRLLHCGSLLEQMAAALKAVEAAVELRLLEALLQQQAVRSAGTLIAWVQQRREQLLAVESVLGIGAVANSGNAASSC
jgi:hypothetical protein